MVVNNSTKKDLQAKLRLPAKFLSNLSGKAWNMEETR